MDKKMEKTWINSGHESTSKNLEMAVITDKAGLLELAPTGDAETGDRAGVCVHVCVCMCAYLCFYTVLCSGFNTCASLPR